MEEVPLLWKHLSLLLTLLLLAYTYLTYWTSVFCVPFHFESTDSYNEMLSEDELDDLRRLRRYLLTLLRIIMFLLIALISLMLSLYKLGLKVTSLYLLLTLMLLLTGEVTMRYLMESRMRRKLARVTVPLLRTFLKFSILILPVKFLFDVSALIAPSDDNRDIFIAEMLANLFPAGEVPPEERKLLRSVFQFQDTTVKEIMTPRIDVVAISSETSVQEIIELTVRTGFSKFPVYENRIDNIIGVVYTKDVLSHFLSGSKKRVARELAKSPYYVPENKKIDELLREMQRRKITIAIVLDEFGGFSGIVTLEDILEELVGELQDEHTKEEPLYESLGDNSLLVSAKLPLDDLRDLLGLGAYDPFESYDVDTVGGLVYAVLGELPREGEEFQLNGIKFKVIEMDGQRVERVVVTLVRSEADNSMRRDDK